MKKEINIPTGPKEPFRTKEEFTEAFNRYQGSIQRRIFYDKVRRKAIRRTLSFLRKKYSSEYEAYLNRSTEELTKQERNKEKMEGGNHGMS